MREYLNIEELSEYLGIKKSTLYAKVASGQIPHYKIGHLVRFKKADIDCWMESLKQIPFDASKKANEVIKGLNPEIGHLTLSQITPPILSAYKTKRLEAGLKPSTVVKELQFIRRVFSLSKREWQLIKQSPFEFFKLPKVNDQRVRFLEQGEFERLLLSCPSWLRPIIVLARYTGLRRGNVLDLTWNQVDLKNRIINLEHTKNGQRLSIPLSDTPYNMLLSLKGGKVTYLTCPFVFHQDGKPFTPDQVTMAFKRACRRAGIENFRFHDLRHDFASTLVQRGNDLYVVQNLLGHSDGRMTKRYAHLKIENLRNAVKSLEGDTAGDTKSDTVEDRVEAHVL